MAYEVINEFIDKEDNDAHYKAGDSYPKGEYKPIKKRVDELSKEHPKYKRSFIKEVRENKEKQRPSSKK